MGKYFTPNISKIEADQQRTSPPEKKKENELVWHNLLPDHRDKQVIAQVRRSPNKTIEQDNELYIGPPWNESGRFYKIVSKHWDLPGVDSDKRWHYSYEMMFPEWLVENSLQDPFTTALNKLQKRLPEVDLSSYYPGTAYFVNAYDPSIQDPMDFASPGFTVLRITSKMYNTLLALLKNPRIGNFMDPTNAVMINVKKKAFIQKEGKMAVRYELVPIPVRGPIHPDESTLDNIMSTLTDLDKIWKPPTEEQFNATKQAAEQFYNHMIEKYGSSRTPTKSQFETATSQPKLSSFQQKVEEQQEVSKKAKSMAEEFSLDLGNDDDLDDVPL